MSWETVVLGDVLPFKYGKNLPQTSRSNTGENSVFTSAGLAGTHCDAVTAGPTVVIGRKGSVGSVYYSPEPCWPTDTTFFVEGNQEVDLRFAYYLLQTLPLREMNNDSAVPGLNRSDAHSLQIQIPSRSEQKAIAEVLGALDDKIAANQRIIDAGIQLSESLIRKNLSGTFVPLHNVADVVMGSSPRGEFLNEYFEGMPFYQGVRDFGILNPEERMYTSRPTRVASAGDILLAVRAPVGQVNIAPTELCIGPGLAAIRSNSGHQSVLFYTLRGFQNIWEQFQGAGTVFSSVTKNEVHNVLIPEIHADVADDLEVALSALHSKFLQVTQENQVLARTRDELLPLLMNGKISVAEASEAVETVVGKQEDGDGDV